MTDLDSWRELIDEARAQHNDGPIIACTLTDDELDRRFDSGYGGTQGAPFTAWSEHRVYFPTCYDGAEWVSSAPRSPNGEVTDHVGGG